ncbi:monocarboxylate transporter 9-like isoform X1 [Agrilus planipennis]|nr:monocarboxylate transporter 9-like isoform X1 [Agrilus planipennis]
MMQIFGFVFGDKLHDIGLSAINISVITNTSQAFGLLLGFINGALLKKLGYRKVAFASAFFIFIGFFTTAFANSFTTFLITYGLIYSTGTGMAKSAYFVALNTFFLKQRSKALALSFTISSLGPILLPQLVPYLLYSYGLKGTALILAAILSHTFVAALLLQPIEKHEKMDPEDDTVNAYHKEIITKSSDVTDIKPSFYDFGSTDDLDIINRSTLSLYTERRPTKRRFSNKMYTSLISFSEDTPDKPVSVDNNIIKLGIEDDLNAKENHLINRKKIFEFFKSASKLFELSLIVDPIFINIIIGISLAMFVDLNFAILTALMLTDFGLEKNQIATFMSVQSSAELIFRFAAPYVGCCLSDSPRILYMICLIFLSISRFLFVWVQGFTLLLVSAVCMGIFRGLRTIYMNLVIPSYVPLEKLPGASGIQLFLNGIMFLVGGPILGFVKDVTGSYRGCVILMNCLMLLGVFMWAIEMMIVKNKKKTVDQT